jgi:hypothetical protein
MGASFAGRTHLRPLPGAPARFSPCGASLPPAKSCTLNGCLFAGGRLTRPLPGAPARSSPEGASVRLQKICTLNGCIFCRPDALAAPCEPDAEGLAPERPGEPWPQGSLRPPPAWSLQPAVAGLLLLLLFVLFLDLPQEGRGLFPFV